MAAPPNKTIKDLSGVWVMNKTLSDDTDAILTMQGISWLVRKAIGLATVTLTVKQYTDEAGVVHIDISQRATGISGTTELRTLDWVAREHSDHIFGKVSGRSRFQPLADVSDDFLKTGWLPEMNETAPVQNLAVSVDSDWTAEQIWGFEEVDGKRMYARHVLVTNRKGERQTARLVYDWQPE